MKKTLPIVTQYILDSSIKDGIIEFIKQQVGPADGLFNNTKYVLESYELEIEKVSSLGSLNTSINVGNNHSYSLFHESILL